MSLSDPSQATEMLNTVVKGNGQIASLSEATKGRFLISEDVSVLRKLLEFTSFAELRLRCFKPSHGRTFHGIFNGESLMKKMFELQNTYGLCGSNGNKEVRIMADDTSIIGASTCDRICIGYGTNPSFYDHLIWVNGVGSMVLKENRFECDDFFLNDGFKMTGDWQFYVR